MDGSDWLSAQISNVILGTHLKGGHSASQYKCVIAMIWGYGILYLQFGATLHVNKGLIKNSVIFKIVKLPLSLTSYQWSVPQGTQSPKTYIILYYTILYYITLFYGFNTLVFCNLHCIEYRMIIRVTAA